MQEVCRADDRIYDYAISWLATKVQFSGVPPETAFVMRGEKGTGKGTLGHTIRKIFGVHGMYITQAEHLVGKFNQHLLNCCLLFADEAFFAGDKRHEKVLQALITEPTLVIEKKGVDAVPGCQSPRHHHGHQFELGCPSQRCRAPILRR